MYSVGKFVVYGVQGVCRIMGTEKQLVNRKRTEFLVLEPLSQPGAKFYLPLENPSVMSKLKPVLTKHELQELLDSESVKTDCWISEEGKRKLVYRELLANSDRESLLQMIATLYRHRGMQEASGRKFHQCDENFLRDAEKFFCSEISLVMEMPMNQGLEYLRNQLQ